MKGIDASEELRVEKRTALARKVAAVSKPKEE
jgi:hypothetical protein